MTSQESTIMGTRTNALGWHGSETSILFVSYKNSQHIYSFLNAMYKQWTFTINNFFLLSLLVSHGRNVVTNNIILLQIV